MLVGMIIPDQTNPFFAELSFHLQTHLAQGGVPLVVLSSDNNADLELKCMQTLQQLNVSGIVFLSAGDDARSHTFLKALEKPHIIIDRELPDTSNCDFVLTDNSTGINAAVTHLVTGGHKSLAFIKGSQSTDPGRVRLMAFREAVELKGLDKNKQFEFGGNFDYRSGYLAAQEIIQLAERPTAVLASNDLSAIGALKCFHENGLRVPHDISIIGFDDIAMCQWIYPPLTTVRQETIQLTRFAAELLLSRLFGRYQGPPRQKHVTPTLIVRQSTRDI